MWRVVHSIVMFALVAHMTCGCCFHHALAHPSQSGEACLEDDGGGCCHDEHGNNNDPRDPRRGDGGCEHEQCVLAQLNSDTVPQISPDALAAAFGRAVSAAPRLHGTEAAGAVFCLFGYSVSLLVLKQAFLL